jgi:hypothetical protein
MIVLRKLSKGTGASTNIILSGLLTGAMNDYNKVFYTEYNYKPGKIVVNYNGQELVSPEDFYETGENEITFIYITPLELDVLSTTYEREV